MRCPNPTQPTAGILPFPFLPPNPSTARGGGVNGFLQTGHRHPLLLIVFMFRKSPSHLAIIRALYCNYASYADRVPPTRRCCPLLNSQIDCRLCVWTTESFLRSIRRLCSLIRIGRFISNIWRCRIKILPSCSSFKDFLWPFYRVNRFRYFSINVRTQTHTHVCARMMPYIHREKYNGTTS